jgi:hypothetical protein
MTYKPKNKPKITAFRFVGGERVPGEMARVEAGRTALRIIQTDDGKTLELFAYGWREISWSDLRGLITAKPYGWRVFLREHFPIEAAEWDI